MKKRNIVIRVERPKVPATCGVARAASMRNSAGTMRRSHRNARRAGENRNGVVRGERRADRSAAE